MKEFYFAGFSAGFFVRKRARRKRRVTGSGEEGGLSILNEYAPAFNMFGIKENTI